MTTESTTREYPKVGNVGQQCLGPSYVAYRAQFDADAHCSRITAEKSPTVRTSNNLKPNFSSSLGASVRHPPSAIRLLCATAPTESHKQGGSCVLPSSVFKCRNYLGRPTSRSMMLPPSRPTAWYTTVCNDSIISIASLDGSLLTVKAPETRPPTHHIWQLARLRPEFKFSSWLLRSFCKESDRGWRTQRPGTLLADPQLEKNPTSQSTRHGNIPFAAVGVTPHATIKLGV